MSTIDAISGSTGSTAASKTAAQESEDRFLKLLVAHIKQFYRQRAALFWTIAFPLLSPTTFFLIVVNIVYAFFDTFGVIHAITRGGPNYATDILVFKVYNDGVINLDLGGSAAQSVILMIVVISLTVIQFRYIERKVHY